MSIIKIVHKTQLKKLHKNINIYTYIQIDLTDQFARNKKIYIKINRLVRNRDILETDLDHPVKKNI